MDWRYKAVPSSRERLNISWVFSGVSQGTPQALDRRIQSVVEIDKCVCRPQPATQLFPCNNFTRMLQQHRLNLERLLL